MNYNYVLIHFLTYVNKNSLILSIVLILRIRDYFMKNIGKLSPEQVKICNDINAAIPKMLYDRDIIFAFHHYNHEGRISAVDEYMQGLYNKNYLACMHNKSSI